MVINEITASKSKLFDNFMILTLLSDILVFFNNKYLLIQKALVVLLIIERTLRDFQTLVLTFNPKRKAVPN